jgi:hypothetical protein
MPFPRRRLEAPHLQFSLSLALSRAIGIHDVMLLGLKASIRAIQHASWVAASLTVVPINYATPLKAVSISDHELCRHADDVAPSIMSQH